MASCEYILNVRAILGKSLLALIVIVFEIEVFIRKVILVLLLMMINYIYTLKI